MRGELEIMGNQKGIRMCDMARNFIGATRAETD